MRSLNTVQLIGNITRDPELRYTQNSTPVVSFTLATNRSWTTEQGEKKEESQYHKIIAWNKLAELCSELLTKGALTYISGKLQTRKYMSKDNVEKETTEIVADDMILLSQSKGGEY